MAMSSDEFAANLRVQELKPQVNEADGLSALQIGALTGGDLARLTGAVSTSIAKRTTLASLGRDPGHATRIVVESNILARLNVEVVARQAADAAVRQQAQAAQLAAMPNVLGKSTWGAKKPI
jgi:hypothetical protein